MKLQVIQGDLTKVKADLLVVNEFEDVAAPTGATSAIDKALKGALSANMREENFKAKEGEIFAILSHGYIPARKVILVGLGKKENFSLETVRKVTGSAVAYAQKIGAKTVVCQFLESAQAMTEGALLASYTFDKYKTGTRDKGQGTSIQEFTIVEYDAKKVAAAKQDVTLGEIFAHATEFTRDLINEPPSATTPSHLASVAKEMATETPEYGIEIEIFGKNQLKEMGAGGILGISQGSVEEPYLIHLVYKPNSQLVSSLTHKLQRVALVGKGVTFDSGGLSLKPGQHMDDMKLDMSAAAAIIGVFSVLGRLKPAIEIHGIIPAVENMLSGSSIKLGDVVKTMSGKTIEILNSDAEGRVILSDALEYANRQNPDAIIDLATLTGSVMVGLGTAVAGLFSNDSKLEQSLREAGDNAGERIWPLPMPQEYKEELKSDIADLSNTHPTRYGDAIIAAMFLREFVKPGIKWAHLDIAGPVFNKKPISSYIPKGASGFGVRTLLNYVLNVSR